MLKLSSTHLKVIVCPKDFENRSETCPLSKICCVIREAVEAGIRQVTADINYVDAQHYVTFPCGCESDHPSVLEFVDSAPSCLTCSKTNEKFKLPVGYKLWQIRGPDSKKAFFDDKESHNSAKCAELGHSADSHQSAPKLPSSQQPTADGVHNGRAEISISIILLTTCTFT